MVIFLIPIMFLLIIGCSVLYLMYKLEKEEQINNIVFNKKQYGEDIILDTNDKYEIIQKLIDFKSKEYNEKVINSLLLRLNRCVCVDNIRFDKSNIRNFLESVKDNGIDIYKIVTKNELFNVLSDNLPDGYGVIVLDEPNKILASLFLLYVVEKYNLYGARLDDNSKYRPDVHKLYYSLVNYLKGKDNELSVLENISVKKYMFIKHTQLKGLYNVINIFPDSKYVEMVFSNSDENIKSIFIDIMKTYVCDSLLDENKSLNEIKRTLEKNGINVRQLLENNISDHKATLINTLFNGNTVIELDFQVASVINNYEKTIEYVYDNKYCRWCSLYRDFLYDELYDFLKSNYVVSKQKVKFVLKK